MPQIPLGTTIALIIIIICAAWFVLYFLSQLFA